MDKRLAEALRVRCLTDKVIMSNEFQLIRDPRDHFNGINISSEMSLIIKEAGRLCEHYASDAFYDLRRMHDDLMGAESVLFKQDEYLWVIGIRETGCDGPEFLRNRLESQTAEREYRKIYVLRVWRTEPNWFRKSLIEVDRYMLQQEFDRLDEKEETNNG